MRKIFILFMISIILNGFHPAISHAHESPVNEQGCHGILLDTVYLPIDRTHLNIYDTHCHNDDEAPDIIEDIKPNVRHKFNFYVGAILAFSPIYNSVVQGFEFEDTRSAGILLGVELDKNISLEYLIKNTVTTATTGHDNALPVTSSGTWETDSHFFNIVVHSNPLSDGQQIFVSYGNGRGKASYDGAINNATTLNLELDDITVKRSAIGIKFKIEEANHPLYMRLGVFNENYGDNEVSGIELGIFGF